MILSLSSCRFCALSPVAAEPAYRYARADATRAYQPSKLERFTREIVHLREPNLLVVLDRVRAEVPPLEWDVFRLTVLEDVDSKAAAEQLHIEIGYLYVCRSRVKRVLRRILEQGDE